MTYRHLKEVNWLRVKGYLDELIYGLTFNISEIGKISQSTSFILKVN